MARPRVFVSSTFYDLKHIRSSLDVFIDSLGYESILSEKGDIAYAHDISLDESCYREVGTADIFVLIVGGRYGSAASRENRQDSNSFFDRYESVTKLEHTEAIKRDIPIFILVESPVYAEYQTYLRNKDSKTIAYAHVDSVNVFTLLEEILNRRRNNPVHTFDRFSDIENWLREQWAGLFREHLQRTSSQQQIAALSEQVNALREVSNTLKRYLEAVVTKVVPRDVSDELIEKEKDRLKDYEEQIELRSNAFVREVIDLSRNLTRNSLPISIIRDKIRDATSFEHFGRLISDASGSRQLGDAFVELLESVSMARVDFNLVRQLLGKPPLGSAKADRTNTKEDVADKLKRRKAATKDSVSDTEK